jgi:branched-chain amino acid transport system ATP-binding protein
MSRENNLLVVDKIDVYRDTLHVLKNVSLVIEKDKITAVVGSNGAGKSTLLNTIAGLLRPASGVIKFEERDITKLETHEIARLGISLVPEGRHVFPHLTVLENLLVACNTQEAKKNINRNLKYVYELFPRLEERKKQLAEKLSGGEQQMLAIARGIMSSPKLLLLDEVSLGLSPKLTEEVFSAIKKIQKDFRVTMLIVEQNVHKALSIADKGYVIEKGEIVLEGSGEELYSSPQVKTAYGI